MIITSTCICVCMYMCMIELQYLRIDLTVCCVVHVYTCRLHVTV